ncbi:hypothetical protein [Gemmatimonas sp.]|uniref:hypothetical protein n=1 Tax=Gemmatimonas sp. TaxID=1962908 RepID=UPI0035617552
MLLVEQVLNALRVLLAADEMSAHTGIAPADLGASNRHSCGCCASRAFADFARTAVRAAASELSESRLVRAKLAEHAKSREEQQD